MRPVLLGFLGFIATLVVADHFVTKGYYTHKVARLLAQESNRAIP